MLQPGRNFSASSYRYGFNGKENDNEVKGTGNQQDYGMRIYDPRIGKFLSVDPLITNYPELTPYQFASNRPIQGADLDGLEFISKASENAYYHRGPFLALTQSAPPSPSVTAIMIQQTHTDQTYRPKPVIQNTVNAQREKELLVYDTYHSTGLIGPESQVKASLAASKQEYYAAIGEKYSQ